MIFHSRNSLIINKAKMRVRGLTNIGIFTMSSGDRFSKRFFALNRGEKSVKFDEFTARRFSRSPAFRNEADVSFSKTARNAIPIVERSQWMPEIFESFFSMFKTERATKLHEYVDEKHKELGPIFRYRIGPVETIFVNSPEDFRKIFRLEGPAPMHFLPETWHLYNELRNCQRGLLFMDGEEWMKFRRIMNKVMLIPNAENIMAPRCYEAAKDLVDEWKILADNSATIPGLETRLYRWSIEVMLATLIGSSWKTHKPRVDEKTIELARILHRIFELSAKLSLVSVKQAIKFRLPIWREFCRVADEAFDSVRSIVKEIIRLEGDGLLSSMMKEGITNEKDLVRIVADLVIAAGDTTAFSTQWSLLMLAKNPIVQEKLNERLSSLDEKDTITDSYVKAIIRESLRLHPTAPFLTRILPEDAIIAGHRVSKGELLIMSIYSSGRDATNFPRPNDFLPERWLRNEAGNYEQVKNPHASLPFAFGARSCVGRKLAETQMILTISQIVKNFRIECPNADAIKMILHLIAVPSEPIKLRLSNR